MSITVSKRFPQNLAINCFIAISHVLNAKTEGKYDEVNSSRQCDRIHVVLVNSRWYPDSEVIVLKQQLNFIEEYGYDGGWSRSTSTVYQYRW